MVEDARVENLIYPDSKKETLEIVYLPKSPTHVVDFFNFMKSHIVLESNGMGVSLRESREGLSNLMKKEGYEYQIYKNFIESFENKLLHQHYEKTKKEE